MSYDAETGTVIDRSKMHLGLKRNFQGMPGDRARGERAKFLKDPESAARPAAPVEPVSEFAARAKAAWARLIRKVYAADPLVCPKCKGPGAPSSPWGVGRPKPQSEARPRKLSTGRRTRSFPSRTTRCPTSRSAVRKRQVRSPLPPARRTGAKSGRIEQA